MDAEGRETNGRVGRVAQVLEHVGDSASTAGSSAAGPGALIGVCVQSDASATSGDRPESGAFHGNCG